VAEIGAALERRGLRPRVCRCRRRRGRCRWGRRVSAGRRWRSRARGRQGHGFRGWGRAGAAW